MKMKINLPAFVVLCSAATVLLSSQVFAEDLIIASFENVETSDIGTPIGTWSSNPLDTSQGCRMEIIPLYGVMGKESEESHVLKLSYDVATNGPALNGIYIKLNNTNLDPYDEMSVLVKGDDVKSFTTKFKVEFRNIRGERAAYVLKGITSDWRELRIPLKRVNSSGSITDWTKMTEVLFSFDDMSVDSKEGVLYIDEVKFGSRDRSE